MNQVITFFKKLLDTSCWLSRQPAYVSFFTSKPNNATRQNITHRNGYRKKEENINNELNDLFNSIDEVLFSVNMITLKVIHISNSCEKLYGYSPDDFLADHTLWFKIVHPDDKHIFDNEAEILENGEPINNQYRIIRKDKGIRWIETKIIPTLDKRGKLLRVNGITRDITEKRNLKESLEKEKYFLDALMDNMPEAIYFKDQESKLMRVSKYMADHFGVSMESLIGKSDFDFQSEIHAKEAYKDEQVIQKTGKPKIDYIEKEINEDGTETWVSTTKMPLINAHGKVVGTFGISRDITKRKLDEESLKRSEVSLEIKNNELERKNKELEQFAYVASHDLQEPLRTTASFAELLQQQYYGKLDKMADKYLTYIQQSSDRMKALIKDLMDYSRIGNKRELQYTDCNSMIKEVIADINAAMEESQAHIEADILPVINCYPTEIKQLFQNLLINALKFRKKDIQPRIKISAKINNGVWQFAFEDNGIGIEEQHQERIFIIFQRLHTRSEYEGSGIGLAHCKKIVELHGGKIWIKSIPGSGTTFYFTIPENNNL